MLRARIGDPRTGEVGAVMMSAWVPRWRMVVAEDGTWMRISARGADALERVTRGMSGFPPQQVESLRYSEIDRPTAARTSRAAPPPTEDGNTPWWLLGPAAIALWLAVALLVRRSPPRPAPTSS